MRKTVKIKRVESFDRYICSSIGLGRAVVLVIQWNAQVNQSLTKAASR
jgi:hypothetical protein